MAVGLKLLLVLPRFANDLRRQLSQIATHMSRLSTYAVTLPLLAGFAAATVACDYTIRDIGFVRRETKPLKLLIAQPTSGAAERLPREFSEQFDAWNFSIELVQANDPRLQGLESASDQWITWLSGVDGRITECARSPIWETFEQSLRHRFQSKLAKAIQAKALSAFAQVIVFNGDSLENPELLRDIETAVEAAKRLNALQPKPNLLPIEIHQVSSEDTSAEQVMLANMGIDWQSKEPAIAVIYGRGLLAGPTIAYSQACVRELLAQLSLVGASCECGTSRQWTRQNVVPFEWTEANADDSAHYLKFDPDSNLVRTEVARILGQRAGRLELPGNRVDPISHLVESYLDAELPEYAAPDNGDTPFGSETVEATVLKGEGWGFETEVVPPTTVSIPPGRSSDTAEKVEPNLEPEILSSPESDRPQVAESGFRWGIALGIGGAVLALLAGIKVVLSRTS